MDEVPQLDAEFRRLLEKIVKEKVYDGEDWREKFYPKVVERLNQLQLVGKDNDKIIERNKKILNELNSKFRMHPPFTVLRFFELLLESPFVLNSIENLLKYHNSLCKTIMVSSNITDFPPVTSEKPLRTSLNPGSSCSSFEVRLVEIPWLKDKLVNKAIFSSGPDILLSPRRRRDDDEDEDADEEQEEDSKRPKHDKDLPKMKSIVSSIR
jgi:hypothetical protein